MIRRGYFLITTLVALYILYACGAKTAGNDSDSKAGKRQYTEQQNPVDVMVLKQEPFKKELVNNGKLVALRKSGLQFKVSGQLEKIPVHNGDFIKAGELIAGLNPFTYQQQSGSAQIQLKSARLELQNILIGQGYNTLDSTKIPEAIYEMALIKSGYAEALQGLQTARYNLESTRLNAPFNGIVANIGKKQYDQVSTGETFCTLIDNNLFEVEFRIMENEMNDIRLNDKVQLIPFSGQSVFYGTVSEINPVIDENGLIKVKAQVQNTGPLMEGMNVKVLVEKEIPNQLVVPKSAVLLRQNQEVLFKYTHGTAFWTYVQTTAENSTSYSVIAHPDKGGTLEPGDTVIISGNLNLAHESVVVIR